MFTYRRRWQFCFIAVLTTLLGPSVVLSQPAEPALNRVGGERKVLDHYTDVVGIGPASQKIVVIKYATSNGEVRVEELAVNGGGLANLTVDGRAPAPASKISKRLRAQFAQVNDGQRAALANAETKRVVVVWLVDKSERVGVVSELEENEVELDSRQLPSEDKKPSYKEVAKSIQRNQETIQRHYKETIAAFLKRAKIKSRDIEHRYLLAPAVAIRLTWNDVEKVAARDDVRFLFSNETVTKELDVAAPASLGPRVWDAGWTGSGVTIAIVGEPGRVAFENENLNIPSSDVRNPNAAPVPHATRIAGILASSNDHFRGIAFHSRVLDANRVKHKLSVDVDAATDWAMTRQSDILLTCVGWHGTNDGSLHWSDIYADYVVHYNRKLWVKSAGNRRSNFRVTSPGRGYNSLVVGNVRNFQTLDWSDDQMSQSSRFSNPITGTEKPEVVAYGELRSTVPSSIILSEGGISQNASSGTSFAAPIIAGIAGCCIQRSPHLADEPQTLKAKIMVSGLAQNVECGERLSDRDGAGCAKATAVFAASHSRTIRNVDFDATGRLELSPQIPLRAADRKRIVLVYTHPPVSREFDPRQPTHQLSDLDLELYVDDELVASSSESRRNPFEIIDFDPEKNGNAKLKIRRIDWHSDVQSLRIGVAWASRSILGESPSNPERNNATLLEGLPSQDVLVERWNVLDAKSKRKLWSEILQAAR